MTSLLRFFRPASTSGRQRSPPLTDLAANRGIGEALALRPSAGPYLLQAAIASLQAEEDIDWDEVTELYELLERRTGSLVAALNRAVAVVEAGAPERALELVDLLDPGEYRYFHSTRAEMLRHVGHDDEAAPHRN